MKRTFLQAAVGAGLAALIAAGCASKPKFEEPPQAAGEPVPPTPPPAHVEYRPQTPYHLPLISIGAKFSALPPAVQNTIRAQVGTLTMDDIVKDASSGTTVYKIYFRYEELWPPLFIAPDGSVLNPDLTVAVPAPTDEALLTTGGHTEELKMGDLPPPVVKTIQRHAPSGEIAHITKEVWGNRDIYIISFKDPTHNPKLYIAPDGTLAGGTHQP